MNIQNFLALIVQGLLLYQADQSELEAGIPVLTPGAEIGTVGGKPLYAFIALGTNRGIQVQNPSA